MKYIKVAEYKEFRSAKELDKYIKKLLATNHCFPQF